MISVDIICGCTTQLRVDSWRASVGIGTTSMEEARILVVDDYAPWRTQVRSLLKARPEWHIVDEAANGQEAVEKAADVQPDIILLDVTIPG